jgi:murein L,D-transpeptidase YafK
MVVKRGITMKNIKLTIGICLWSILWLLIGMYVAKADMVMDSVTSPAYHFMPQNLYHNTIYNNHVSDSYKINKTCSNRIDRIEVYKSEKRMVLIDDTDCVIKEYTVRVGFNKGPKQCEGDKKTPEGTYKIIEKRDSKYERFLALDYPRPKDLVKAEELGCNPGNAIGIHYFNKDVMDKNTQYSGSNGCITVWNKDEIREISRLVKVGTKVIIKE